MSDLHYSSYKKAQKKREGGEEKSGEDFIHIKTAPAEYSAYKKQVKDERTKMAPQPSSDPLSSSDSSSSSSNFVNEPWNFFSYYGEYWKNKNHSSLFLYDFHSTQIDKQSLAYSLHGFIGLLTVIFAYLLLRKFYYLTQETSKRTLQQKKNDRLSRKKTQFYEEEEAEKEEAERASLSVSGKSGKSRDIKDPFSNKLKNLTKQICPANQTNGNPFKQYAAFFREVSRRVTSIDGRRQSLPLQSNETSNPMENEEFLEELKILLEEFMKKNPLQVIADARNESFSDSKNEESMKSTEGWRNEEFQEILFIQEAIQALADYYSSYLKKEQERLLIAGDRRGRRDELSMQTRYGKLNFLKDVLLLYYRYILTIMEILSYHKNYHQAFKIYEIIQKLAQRITKYESSNKVLKDSALNDMVYNQELLKLYQLTADSPTANLEIHFNLEDVHSYIEKCEGIIEDFFESKKLEIETEEKNFIISQQQQFTQVTQSFQPPLIRNDPNNQGFRANRQLLAAEIKTNDGSPIDIEEDDKILTETQVSIIETVDTVVSLQQTAVDQQIMLHASNQQTYQLINLLQYQNNVNNYRTRLQNLEKDKISTLQKYHQSAVQTMEKIHQDQTENHDKLVQKLENIYQTYLEEYKKIKSEIYRLTEHLIQLQQFNNYVIFQMTFFVVIVFILIFSAKYDLQCHVSLLDGSKRYYHHQSQLSQQIYCILSGFFGTLEEIATQINQETYGQIPFPSFASLLGTIKSATSESAATQSTSYFSPSYYYNVLNPFDSGKWIYLLSVLQSGLGAIFALMPSLSQLLSPVADSWSAYYPIFLCLLMLVIRHVPIFMHQLLFKLFGFSWYDSMTNSIAANSHSDADYSLYRSMKNSISSRLSSMTLWSAYKLILYLYCYGDIIQIIFHYFFKLFFITFAAHWFFWFLFDRYNLPLVLIQNTLQYLSFYILYCLTALGIIALTTEVSFRLLK